MAAAENAVIVELPPLGHIITDAVELTARIDSWRGQGAHVLSPASTVTAFPPNYGVVVCTVYVNTREEAGEIYRDKAVMGENERGLSRIGLQRLEQLAGMSWLPYSRRTDDRRIQHYWEYESWAGLIGYDGQPRTVKGTAEVDFRDGSAQITSFTDRQLNQARRFGLRQCETKSQSAAVRAALGLKSKYTVDQLALPFIVLKVTYLPDANDPRVMQMIAERATSGIASLYPHGGDVVPFGRRELGPATESAVDELVIPATAKVDPVAVARTSAPAPSQPPAQAAPAPAQAPAAPATHPPTTQPPRAATVAALPEDACYVESYRDEKKTKRDGGSFTKAWIVTSDGRELTTVFWKHQDQLKQARDNRTPLRIVDKRHEFAGSVEMQVDRIEDVDAPRDVALPGITPGAPIKL